MSLILFLSAWLLTFTNLTVLNKKISSGMHIQEKENFCMPASVVNNLAVSSQAIHENQHVLS